MRVYTRIRNYDKLIQVAH